MVRRPGRGYRYGRWRGGPDPLAPPYDLGNAVDEIGDSVLGGSGVREALRELLRRGPEGGPGPDELRRYGGAGVCQARKAGGLDGTPLVGRGPAANGAERGKDRARGGQ